MLLNSVGEHLQILANACFIIFIYTTTNVHMFVWFDSVNVSCRLRRNFVSYSSFFSEFLVVRTFAQLIDFLMI